MTGIASTARRSAHSPAMAALARFGLSARAFVYIVIGWLALQIAAGHHTPEANQRGALADIAQHSFGVVLLWLLGLGFAAYALWRLSEAAFGTAVDGDSAGPRLQALARGVVYAGLAVSTFAFIAGTSRQSQSHRQATLTARVMKHDFGRWLVGIAGAIVVLIGLAMIVKGVTRKFQKELRMDDLTGRTRTVVVALGTVGSIARGAVFTVTGALVIEAAVTFDPGKSTGLDGALRTLADHAYGPWLLIAAALGLIAFGLYGFAAARWAKT